MIDCESQEDKYLPTDTPDQEDRWSYARSENEREKDDRWVMS